MASAELGFVPAARMVQACLGRSTFVHEVRAETLCDLCGCREFIRQGEDAVLRRAVEIVAQLKMTPENVADYEDTELIASIIAPFGSRTDEVCRTAQWISDMHATPGLINVNTRYDDYARAFTGIFSRLPARRNPREIATIYHQLEQLNKELDDETLASTDSTTREALQSLRRVHDEPEAREARLRKRYGL